MPRKKRSSSPFDLFDEVFDDDSSSKSGNPPIQRNAANARERARMRVLSSAFGRLKTKLPNIPADTKLSKLDTLRLATMYIKQLKTLVDNGPASVGENADFSFSDDGETPLNKGRVGSQNLTWPFALHHIPNSRQNTVPHINWNNSQQDSLYKLSNGQSGDVFPQTQYNCNVAHWYRDDCNSKYPAECSYGELIQTPLQYTSEQFGHIQLQ